MRIAVRNSYEPSSFTAPDVSVFFDVWRASTTLLSLVHVGASKILSANDEETCQTFVGQGYALVSEVYSGGIDNSPTQVLAGAYRGRHVIHKSTNLTEAVFHNRACGRALIGGFGNATLVARYLAASGAQTVELIAASHFRDRTEAVEDVSGAATIEAMILGTFLGAAPREQEVRTKFDRVSARRPSIDAHVIADMVLALEIDRFPYLIEAKTVNEKLMEIVKL